MPDEVHHAAAHACLQAGDSPDPPGGVYFFFWITTAPGPPRELGTSLMVV